MSVKEEIREFALELGFDGCRFASAAAPDHADAFTRWIDAGRHGEMDWLRRSSAKRLDPQQVLPGARTVIVLAASYSSGPAPAEKNSTRPNPPSDPVANFPVGRSSPLAAAEPQSKVGRGSRRAGVPATPPRGLVARYARGPDYHKILEAPLKILADWVGDRGGPGCRCLWYTDTGPILERDLAQRAGLGFIGKHTNLIGRGLGNWFLLAEIVTTLDLPPDAPETNHCGKCVKCISACPTLAIRAPFELDARRCISYLTIELKGSIPVEWRPAIGNRIFGCDDCLAVCPWNRFAREGALMRAQTTEDLATPGLLDLLRLDEDGFKQRFAGTPILRAKRRGLLRNVCVALGNTGSEAELPALEKARGDKEPLIAEHAAWAIEQIEAREKSTRIVD